MDCQYIMNIQKKKKERKKIYGRRLVTFIFHQSFSTIDGFYKYLIYKQSYEYTIIIAIERVKIISFRYFLFIHM